MFVKVPRPLPGWDNGPVFTENPGNSISAGFLGMDAFAGAPGVRGAGPDRRMAPRPPGRGEFSGSRLYSEN